MSAPQPIDREAALDAFADAAETLILAIEAQRVRAAPCPPECAGCAAEARATPLVIALGALLAARRRTGPLSLGQLQKDMQRAYHVAADAIVRPPPRKRGHLRLVPREGG